MYDIFRWIADMYDIQHVVSQTPDSYRMDILNESCTDILAVSYMIYLADI